MFPYTKWEASFLLHKIPNQYNLNCIFSVFGAYVSEKLNIIPKVILGYWKLPRMLAGCSGCDKD